MGDFKGQSVDQGSLYRSYGDTCGFRDALPIFESVAKTLRLIDKNKGLHSIRNSRIWLRFEITSCIKPATITIAEAEQLVQVARKFMRQFDTNILGFPLLD